MESLNFFLDRLSDVVLSPYTVKEVTNNYAKSHSAIKIHENIFLYDIDGYYDALYIYGGTMFRLFHLSNNNKSREAFELFDLYKFKLLVICNSLQSILSVSELHSVCYTIRVDKLWSPVHICVKENISGVYSNSVLQHWINSQECDCHFTPLHLATRLKKKDIIEELLSSGASLQKLDDDGNTPVHHAIKIDDDEILEAMCKRGDSISLNMENDSGETPLILTCILNKTDMCKMVLQYGANPAVSSKVASPLHYALKYGNDCIAEILLEQEPCIVNLKCNLHGGLPLHWCKTSDNVTMLLKYKSPLDIASTKSHYPLHIMVLRGRLEAAVSLILGHSDVNSKGNKGNTALHLAINNDHVMLVKMLLLFGADYSVKNDFGDTPGRIALKNSKKNREVIIEMLSCVGGLVIQSDIPFPQNLQNNNLDLNICQEQIPLQTHNRSNEGSSKRTKKLKVLCLDGGGIKGLVLTQLLMAIEKETGKTSKELFDWIAGTSTGALLALGLAQNRSAVEVQRLYFNMKDKIFKGSRPYKAEPFEDFLKQELGEHTTMECLKNGPKVVITASLADRKPVRLHLFRNYSLASDNLPKINNFSSKVKPDEIETLQKNEPPFDQLLWKVARCSGAAPTYFRPMDHFLDGGLLANNPTLDTLTEIHKYNKENRCCSSESKQVGVVLSLGTGLIATSVAR